MNDFGPVLPKIVEAIVKEKRIMKIIAKNLFVSFEKSRHKYNIEAVKNIMDGSRKTIGITTELYLLFKTLMERTVIGKRPTKRMHPRCSIREPELLQNCFVVKKSIKTAMIKAQGKTKDTGEIELAL